MQANLTQTSFQQSNQIKEVPKFFKQLTFSRELNFLFLSILLFAMAMGINFVTFPTVLNNQGVSPANIGIAFTIDSFGGILMSFFLSKFVARLTMMSALKITAFVYSGIILLIYFYQNFYLWLVLAFVMGACWFAYTITRQSWLNILLEDSQRGVATGIFSMTISVGLALGPIIVKFSGADNYFSFVIAAVLAFTSFLCLLPLRNKPQPILEAKRIGLKEFFKNNPRCFMARFFLDFQTYLLFSFTVIFGVKIGLSYEAAGLLITAYMASALFDLGVGFSLKKFNPYRLIKFGFLGCASCFLAIILIRSYPALVAIYFLFGICIACIYVSVFKVCNDDYDKEKLVAANATFQLIGSSGSLFGSLLGAILVEYFGINGFPCAMVLSCVFYLTFLAFYEKN